MSFNFFDFFPNNSGNNQGGFNLFDHIESPFNYAYPNNPRNSDNDERKEETPPASNSKVISKLSPKVITKEDIDIDYSFNRECSICLKPQIVGDLATKLLCGHIFCKECIIPWLQKKCTCPVCRFEFETDDVAYEKSRQERMAGRKYRFTINELNSKSIRELKAMCNLLNIKIPAHTIDRSDIMKLITESNLIIIEQQSSDEKTNNKVHHYSFEDLLPLTRVQLKRIYCLLFLKRDMNIDDSSLNLKLTENLQYQERLGLIDAILVKTGRHGLTTDEIQRVENYASSLSLSKIREFLNEQEVDYQNVFEKSELINLVTQCL